MSASNITDSPCELCRRAPPIQGRPLCEPCFRLLWAEMEKQLIKRHVRVPTTAQMLASFAQREACARLDHAKRSPGFPDDFYNGINDLLPPGPPNQPAGWNGLVTCLGIDAVGRIFHVDGGMA